MGACSGLYGILYEAALSTDSDLPSVNEATPFENYIGHKIMSYE